MKEIKTYKGLVTVVDDDVYEAVKDYKYYTNQKGHVYRNSYVNKKVKTILLHRDIMAAPIDMQVDHINGNPLDNRRENLRLATRKQNHGNTKKPNVENPTSQYKGVCWIEISRAWKATITNKSLGFYETEDAAAHAYNEAAIEEWGEFAWLNEVPSDPDWKNKKIPSRRDGVGTSSFIGVSWSKASKKWQTHIMVNYKSIYLGCFDDEVDAAKAYNEAALKYRGDKAKLNTL